MTGGIIGSFSTEAPAMPVPSVAQSRSVVETIQEVKVVQIWQSMMRSCEMRGKELLDAGVITPADLYEWVRAKNSDEAAVLVLVCLVILSCRLFSTLSKPIRVVCCYLMVLK